MSSLATASAPPFSSSHPLAAAVASFAAAQSIRQGTESATTKLGHAKNDFTRITKLLVESPPSDIRGTNIGLTSARQCSSYTVRLRSSPHDATCTPGGGEFSMTTRADARGGRYNL